MLSYSFCSQSMLNDMVVLGHICPLIIRNDNIEIHEAFKSGKLKKTLCCVGSIGC
jgi:hypothetical protein